MALPDVVLSVSLLSVGGVFVGAGLRYLDRRDRLEVEAARQSNCRWHQWQAAEEGIWLVCGLCGKRSRKLNPRENRGGETVPSENIYP
jgi:hypothetical protein